MNNNPSNVTEVQDLFGKMPPASQEAEQSILGCILLDNQALNKAVELLIEGDFYRQGHRLIFAAMCDMFERGEAIDILTLIEELSRTNKLEKAGGKAYIAGLADVVPAAAHAGSYAKIVREKAILRQLIATTQEIAARAYEDTGDVETFLDEAESAIFDVADRKIRPSFYPLKTVVKETFKTLERLSENRGAVTGVATGYKDLDEITAGMHPGDLIVIAARPGMGKTALALNIARNAALEGKMVTETCDGKVPTAFFSLEMAREQLAIRLFCSEARVDSRDVRRGFIEKADWGKLTRAANILHVAPMFIDDTPSISVLEMKAKCRRLKAENNLGLVVVDYIQLMRGRQTREGNREQEVADISRSLKGLAKELSLPVLALSQLNRGVESRPDKRPRLADLRESGAIEQDADVIMFIYRESKYKTDEEVKAMDEPLKTELIIGKQRNGPVGTVYLTFLEEFTRFESYIPSTTAFGPE